MLVVHHLNNSRSQRILWLLEELGAPYEIKFYQRDATTNLAPPELLAVNPLGKSPVITDGDITIAQIKKRTGNKLVLMGGVELKHLEAASGDFVEKLIRDLVAQGKPGGNYVVMPTAAPINIPLAPKTEENYKRFINTALECGKY